MKKSIIPPKLTAHEQFRYDGHLSMNKYWFDILLKPNSRYVDNPLISIDELDKITNKRNVLCADVYARDCILNAGKPDERDGIYCYFIFFDGKVWKSDGLIYTAEMIQIIEKEFNWNKYEFEKEQAEWAKAKSSKKIKRISNKKKAA